MATDAERDNKRRGYWLRMARERANYSQATAAEMLGLSNQSKSTMSAWEAGTREPRIRYLKAMAELYGVPLSVFTDPEPTAEERLDALVSDAGGLEREDWEAGERGRRPAAGDTGVEPHRRTA